MLKIIYAFILTLMPFSLNGQDPEKILTSVFDEALTDRTAYANLEFLCKNSKGRINGSPMAQKAVDFTFQALIAAGADIVKLEKLQALAKYFAPYNIRDFDRGGGGSDISPLKELGALQIGYMPDTQRYFSYHHSANDTFEQVNIRELQMGSAAIASLIYLIDLLDY